MAESAKAGANTKSSPDKTRESRGPGKERLNQERRREVLDVAARLFAENGFHGTSMDDIARELGILKGSLYYWIDSKEALLSEILEGSVLETLKEGEEIVAREAPAVDRLRALIRSHIDSWIRNPNNFGVYISEWRWLDPTAQERYMDERLALENLYKTVIKQGIGRGEFSIAEREVSINVNLIFGAMNWFPRWYRPDGWASPDDIADILANLVINGLTSTRKS